VALAAETDTKGDVRQGRCMSVAAAERNAARRDARARAEAAPAAASMTLYTCEERAVTSRAPVMPSTAARALFGSAVEAGAGAGLLSLRMGLAAPAQ